MGRSTSYEELDLLKLIKGFWRDRNILIKSAGLFIIFGVVIALISPTEYKTEAVLMPELETNQSGTSSLLQRYGGMLGINTGSELGNSNTIPPQLYPKIVSSIPYQAELMNTTVRFHEYDTTSTVFTFFKDIYQPSALSLVKAYTLGLPGKFIGVLFGNKMDDVSELNTDVIPSDPDSIYVLNKEQKDILDNLQERLAVSQDEESGVVTMTVEMPDARAAAEVGKAALSLLKDFVREYRTKKVTADMEFIQQQVNLARKEFEDNQDKLTAFRDRNINLTSAKAQSKEQELQSQYDLAFNTYNSLRQQLEEAKINVQKNTPVFSVIQPVSQPNEKSKPDKKLIVFIFLVFGVMIGLVISLIKQSGIIKEIQRI